MDIKPYTSLFPPGIVHLPSGTFVIADKWYRAPADTKLEDIRKLWTKLVTSSQPTTPDLIIEIVGSKGDVYAVQFGRGGPSCTCAGFGFRRKCSHIDKAKAKLKQLNEKEVHHN